MISTGAWHNTDFIHLPSSPSPGAPSRQAKPNTERPSAGNKVRGQASKSSRQQFIARVAWRKRLTTLYSARRTGVKVVTLHVRVRRSRWTQWWQHHTVQATRKSKTREDETMLGHKMPTTAWRNPSHNTPRAKPAATFFRCTGSV